MDLCPSINALTACASRYLNDMLRCSPRSIVIHPHCVRAFFHALVSISVFYISGCSNMTYCRTFWLPNFLPKITSLLGINNSMLLGSYHIFCTLTVCRHVIYMRHSAPTILSLECVVHHRILIACSDCM